MHHLILHIGTGKTGSTAIQQALSSQPEALASVDAAYPVDADGQHNVLEAALLTPDRWHRVHRSEYRGREAELVARANGLVDDIRRAVAAHDAAIVSSEYLYSLPQPDVQRLVDLLLQGAGHAAAIVYVRQPSSYWLSSLQQFLKHDHQTRGFLNQTYPFIPSIRNWSSVLGADRLRVRAFDRRHLAGGDVVSDFDETLAQILGRAPGLRPSASASNQSFSAEECILLQEFKREAPAHGHPDARRWNQAINAAVGRSARRIAGRTTLTFRPGIAALVDRHHAAQLRELRQIAGIDFGVDLGGADAPADAALADIAARADVADLIAYDPAVLATVRDGARRLLAKYIADMGSPTASHP